MNIFECDYCGEKISEKDDGSISVGCEHYPSDSHKHIRKLKKNKRYTIFYWCTLDRLWKEFNKYSHQIDCDKAFNRLDKNNRKYTIRFV
jgi:predicted 2-oxoglutarate/Fe(II)-dependent dioxygenase YbiX